MENKPQQKNIIPTSLSPWLSVSNTKTALDFYQNAFNAKVVYRMDNPDGSFIARLSVDGAEFWISDTSEEQKHLSTGGDTIRMILTVADPDAVFQHAVEAGATIVFPVGEDYGWRLGRLVDPFGLHWEIGHELDH
jgi:PhnB protein